jgi:hypothetical protein
MERCKIMDSIGRKICALRAERKNLVHDVSVVSTFMMIGLMSVGCTGQIASSFRLKQQEQSFNSQQEINTKIDLLWVIDNSSSMDVSQEKLRKGFSGFAKKYMQPTWDIQVAVITTDTYLAHSAFSSYLASTLTGTTGWKSPYVFSRLSQWTNPTSNSSLVNLTTGKFDQGVTYRDLSPNWGPLFARLLPGYHDGPITAFCFEGMPYFLKGVANCKLRSEQAEADRGTAKCLNPGSGESSLSQCVNTTQNDTVRSGKAILTTLPPAGVAADAAWSDQLINDFMINVTTGSAGHGSERGLASVLQLLQDNESTSTAFFRKGSLRGVIFVTDEEDQSFDMTLTAQTTGVTPWHFYQCDLPGLLSLNPSSTSSITGTNGLCCSTASKNCRHGALGTSCPSKVVDGVTYTPSICPNAESLIPVKTVKTQLDDFFKTLDATDTPNYFVTSIVPTTADAIQSLQSSRNTEDAQVGTTKTFAVDRGDRYLELGELVGNGSLSMNIAEEDYSPILEAIGRAIISKKGTFTLDRAPTNSEEMTLSISHADGTSTVIPSSSFTIDSKSIVITDQSMILGFRHDDKIVINYQPKTLY